MSEQKTIVYNVGDEPILVEQTDGSCIIIPPGEKRQAQLSDIADYASAAPIAVASTGG